MSGAVAFRAKNYFTTDRNRGSHKSKSLIVLRDPRAEFTGTKWFRQEFIITLRLGYWNPDMIVLDLDDNQLYIVRGNEYASGEYGPQQLLQLPYGIAELPKRYRNVAEQFAS